MRVTVRTIIVLAVVAGLVLLQMADPAIADDPNPFTFAVAADIEVLAEEFGSNGSS